MTRRLLLASAIALAFNPGHAANSIDLSRYSVSATYGLDVVHGAGGIVSGLEASAVTYARDRFDASGARGTLFFVGDEGTGVIEVSRTGQTLGHLQFDWTGTGSSNQDAEGLTYLGGGQLVVAEERLQNLYRFTYTAGGSVSLGSTPFASIGPTIGNVGIEGVSFDPRNGGYVTVKQDNPAQLRIFGSLAFSTTAGTDAVPGVSFSGADSLFGVNSLSDVQTLAGVDALAGTAAADNLLVLSLDSRRLLEIDRQGQTLSSFDLSGVLPDNGIEGVTVDEKGTIYLVAEHIQNGSAPFGSTPKSQLIVLAAPVPEPETYAMMLAGLALLGLSVRRRNRS